MKDREIDEKRPEDVREVGEIEKGTVKEVKEVLHSPWVQTGIPSCQMHLSQ